MARYERIEGTAQRFWEIEVDGRFVITRWGRLGRTPQHRTAEYADDAAAQRRRDVLIREKEGKGYVRVGGELVAERTGAGNPELEAALVAAPDDLDVRQVYADWLMAQDATLGQLIALEVSHARTQDDALLSPIASLRKQCGGDVADRRTVQLNWRLGLIRRARVSAMGTGEELISALLDLPAARTLQVLRLDTDAASNPRRDRQAMLQALGRLAPPHLTTVELHHRAAEGDWDYGDAGPWWASLPAFDTLLVASPQAALPVPTERLRVFGFDAQDLPWHPSLGASWPHLEHLVLARMPVAAVTELLGTLHAPQLHTLALHHIDLESVPWRHLLQSSAGTSLRALELLGAVPWTLRSLLERLGDRVTVRWVGGPAPDPELRPEAASWLEITRAARHQVPW